LGDASNTPAGTLNWTGQASGIGANPLLFPTGIPFDFTGIVNNDPGQGDLASIDAEILVEQLTINFNKIDGSPVTWEATFGVNGVPTEGETGGEDVIGSPSHFGTALDIEIEGLTIEQQHRAIQSASLVFRRPPSTFIRAGATERRPGNLECDLSFVVACPKLGYVPYDANALRHVRLFSAANEYWDLNKIRFLGKSGFSVTRGSPAPIIQYTVTGQWNAVDGEVQGFLSYFDGIDETDYYGTGYET
jgi:hypothetical protein